MAEIFVPQGHLKIARRFNPGTSREGDNRVPKGRLGEPSDLAGPLLFLASAASDFYTGHILYADGGYTAG